MTIFTWHPKGETNIDFFDRLALYIYRKHIEISTVVVIT